jgi:hypothetical protein
MEFEELGYDRGGRMHLILGVRVKLLRPRHNYRFYVKLRVERSNLDALNVRSGLWSTTSTKLS